MKLRTITRKLVDIEAPDESMIDIKDIGYALSNLCRYAGQIPEFYSVAQHSCIVHDMAQRMGETELVCLGALLHDATEAYLADLPSPVKRLCPMYQEIEKSFNLVIERKFGLDEISEDARLSIAAFDKVCYRLERSWIFADNGEVVVDFMMKPADFICVGPEDARRMFFNRFDKLTGGKGESNFNFRKDGEREDNTREGFRGKD